MAADLSIRPAEPDDARFVWAVNNDPAVREQSIQTDAIPWDSHVAWYERTLGDEARRLYITTVDGERAGVVRFDLDGDTAVISVAVDDSFRGRGLGALTIVRGCQTIATELAVKRVEALIRPTNAASLAAFVRAGFQHSGQLVVIHGVELDRMIWEYRHD